MSEVFEEWWARSGWNVGGVAGHTRRQIAMDAWNAATSATVDALKSREKHFKGTFQKNGVLADIRRLKAEGE